MMQENVLGTTNTTSNSDSSLLTMKDIERAMAACMDNNNTFAEEYIKPIRMGYLNIDTQIFKKGFTLILLGNNIPKIITPELVRLGEQRFVKDCSNIELLEIIQRRVK